MAVARFAVFGHPVAHSLSPRIHRAFAEEFGVALVYDTIDAAPEAFAACVGRFFAEGGLGANVTVPHKHAAYALADERSIEASQVEAANVLTVLPDGRLAAHNTDGDGLVRDLRERQRQELAGADVLLIGAGGAARGVAWKLLAAGVRQLTITNRTAAAASALAAALGQPDRVHTCPLAELGGAGHFDIVINATSAGLLGQALALPRTLAGADVFCYDLSYARAALPFLAWARAAGARGQADGLGMLVETAADSYAVWHGVHPQTEPVYRALRAQLADGGVSRPPGSRPSA